MVSRVNGMEGSPFSKFMAHFVKEFQTTNASGIRHLLDVRMVEFGEWRGIFAGRHAIS